MTWSAHLCRQRGALCWSRCLVYISSDWSIDLAETSVLHDAITVVTDLFTRKGYEHASIEDVVQATGLNRYAIYQKFGGKRELLLAALDRHHQDNFAQLAGYFDPEPADYVAALRAFFLGPVEEIIEQRCDGGPGSLMCQVAFMVAPHDEVVNARLHAVLGEKRAALTDMLTTARDRGELSASTTPEAATDLIVTTMFGIAAQAHAGVPRATLLASMDAAFDAISAG